MVACELKALVGLRGSTCSLEDCLLHLPLFPSVLCPLTAECLLHYCHCPTPQPAATGAAAAAWHKPAAAGGQLLGSCACAFSRALAQPACVLLRPDVSRARSGQPAALLHAVPAQVAGEVGLSGAPCCGGALSPLEAPLTHCAGARVACSKREWAGEQQGFVWNQAERSSAKRGWIDAKGEGAAHASHQVRPVHRGTGPPSHKLRARSASQLPSARVQCVQPVRLSPAPHPARCPRPPRRHSRWCGARWTPGAGAAPGRGSVLPPPCPAGCGWGRPCGVGQHRKRGQQSRGGRPWDINSLPADPDAMAENTHLDWQGAGPASSLLRCSAPLALSSKAVQGCLRARQPGLHPRPAPTCLPPPLPSAPPSRAAARQRPS